ncbi:addiction module antidote protein [Thalassolituus marinus]|uniref:Addiction module antidote protein n=1 Tax=Thalassolituus marinus TaxID=671053 RepID=A0ABS7ZW24_9GAMM|nr:addiction module antidote protein [Thalassolituus marinus]MCA6065357.1 putative addiction module antidote protein [Thalassolituus marinus]
MTNTATKPFDAAEYLETEQDIKEFLRQAAEDGNTQHLVHCLGVAVRSKGMSEVATNVGVTRASLYKSFAEGANPKLDTINKVLGVLGCKLSVTADNSQSHA